jgi:hypothetical protein
LRRRLRRSASPGEDPDSVSLYADDIGKQPVRSDRRAAVGAGAPELRASDAERDAVADALRSHCAAGRLPTEELERRLAATLSAGTVGELDQLLRDLPGKRPIPLSARPREPEKVKAGLPGLRSFRQCHELPTAREVAFRHAVEDVLPAIVAAGYDVIARAENELLVFERGDERIVVALSGRGTSGTRLLVQGRARRPVRKAFANLAVD